jgi:hypothetical protein
VIVIVRGREKNKKSLMPGHRGSGRGITMRAMTFELIPQRAKGGSFSIRRFSFFICH